MLELGPTKPSWKNTATVVVGVEENLDKASVLVEKGYRCVAGDASDHDFWNDADLTKRSMLLVSLSNHRENLYVVNLARRFNYQGTLAVISRYPDHQKELEELGCITFNLYAEAGHGFAEHVFTEIQDS